MRIIGNAEKAREVQAVASGVLPSGQPVVVNADGTVSVVGIIEASDSVGSPTSFGTGAVTYYEGNAAFDPSTGKILFAYGNPSNSQYGTAVIGTITGTAISWGTPIVFASEGVDYVVTTYDPDSEKVIIVWRGEGTPYFGRAVVATISGTSASFGSTANFGTWLIGDTTVTYDTSSDKVVVGYRDQDNSDYGTAVVGTVSGTSISFGTPVVFESGGYTSSIRASYDTAANKTLFVYQSSGNKAVVGTVSGTSISFGSKLTSGLEGAENLIYDESASKHVLVNASSQVLTVSGTSVSAGTAVEIREGGESGNKFGGVYDPTTGKIVFAYVNGSKVGKTVNATVSGTTLTFGSYLQFDTAVGSVNPSLAADTVNDKVLIIYRDENDSDKQAGVVKTVAGTLSPNLTSDNYIGTAATGAPDGKAAKINIKGAVFDRPITYYNVANAVYDDVSLTDPVLDFPLSGIFFKPDGTGLFITENSDNRIYFFPLSTAWDLTTKGSSSFMASPSTTPTGIFFKPDGTRMYVNDSGTDLIYEYSLSTAWDLSSTTQTDTFSTTLANPYGLTFKPDGTKFYIVNEGIGVQEFSMSSAWDLTSAAVTSGATLSITDSGGSSGLQFNDDGTELFVIGYGSDAIFKFVLSTAYDITSATSAGSTSVAEQATSPRGLFFKSDGSKLYVLDAAADSVFQYTILGAFTAGQSYYVQTDGTLSTTAGDPSVFAGTAVAATKLIVKG